jgi:hypothetical protein
MGSQTEERIRMRAYELWELAGREDEFRYQAGKETRETTERDNRQYRAQPAANSVANVGNGIRSAAKPVRLRTLHQDNVVG